MCGIACFVGGVESLAKLRGFLQEFVPLLLVRFVHCRTARARDGSFSEYRLTRLTP